MKFFYFYPLSYQFPSFSTIIAVTMANIKIGEKAPDFTLYDSDKNQLTLSGLKGTNVVLLFFPMAFSSVCTEELCGVRDDISSYENLNAKVLGISVDSHWTLDRFKKDSNLNITLLSDFNKEVSEAYGAIYETFAFGMRGVSKRSAIVIDKEGIIRYVEILENAGEIPNLEAVKNILKTI